MATTRAIATVCETVVRILEDGVQNRPDIFPGGNLRFEQYNGANFTSPMENGISLFHYRVTVNTELRTPPDRSLVDGARLPAPPSLDLHLLLTVWAKSVKLEQEIFGWMMYQMASFPIYTTGLLNRAAPDTFRQDEVVEITPEPLTTDELFRVWEALPCDYRISLPYIARNIRIDRPVSENP